MTETEIDITTAARVRKAAAGLDQAIQEMTNRGYYVYLVMDEPSSCRSPKRPFEVTITKIIKL